MPTLSPLPHPPVFLVSETGTLDQFIFSVSSATLPGIAGGKRIIVSLLAGHWGRGPMETGVYMLGTFQSLAESTSNVTARYISFTFQM